MTTDQVLQGAKLVTRRLGWLHLRQGDLLRPVRKCMGLRKGERIEVLRGPIQVVSVRREPLRAMCDDARYGLDECRLEGFEGHPELGSPLGFVSMFCAAHKGCTWDTTITRIHFTYEPSQ